jgi:hypothetical protein
VSDSSDAPFPTWFIRLVVGFAIGLLIQIGAGIWWASGLTSKVDSIQFFMQQSVGENTKDIETLQEDMKTLEDKIANIKRDLAVLLDRGGTVRVAGATP